MASSVRKGEGAWPKVYSGDLKRSIIFQCSKSYGSPTFVTRLKVALNMADPISLNENRP